MSAISEKIKSIFSSYSIVGYTRLLFVSAVVVPTLFFAIFVFQEIETTRSFILNSFEQTVRVQRSMIENWFEEQADKISTFAQLQSTKEGNRAVIAKDAQAFLKNNTEFSWFTFIDAKGTALDGGDVSDREYFKQALHGKAHVTDVLLGRVSKRPLVAFSSPVWDHNGAVIGVIAGSVELKTITAMMEQFKFGNTGETYLADSSGMMVTESRLANDAVARGIQVNSGRTSVNGIYGFEQAIRGQAGSSVYSDFRGQRVVGAYTTISKPQWAVIAEVDESEILAPVYHKLQMFGIAYFFVLAILVYSMAVFTRRVNRPVLALVKRATEIENGFYKGHNEVLPSSTPRELQRLHHAFGSMAQNLIETIGDLNRLNCRITEAEEKFRSLVENSLVGIYYVVDGKIEYLNPRMEEMIGYNLEEAKRLDSFLECVHPDDRELVADSVQQRLSGKTERVEYDLRILRRNGTVLSAHVLASTCVINGNKGVFGSMVDVSEQKKWQETLEYISYHDTNTGLYNRAFFERELARASISGGNIGIIMCDVDGLKQINDALGHYAGDTLLKAAAQALIFDDNRIISARIGGDEFAVLIWEVTEDILGEVSRMISTRIEHYREQAGSLPLHVSMGCCLSNGFVVYDGLRQADDAMYHHKNTKRDWARENITQYIKGAARRCV